MLQCFLRHELDKPGVEVGGAGCQEQLVRRDLQPALLPDQHDVHQGLRPAQLVQLVQEIPACMVACDRCPLQGGLALPCHPPFHHKAREESMLANVD